MKYVYQISGLTGEVDARNMSDAVHASVDAVLDRVPMSRMECNFQVSVMPISAAAKKRIIAPKEKEYLFFTNHSNGNALLAALFNVPGYRRSGNHTMARKLDFIMTDHAVMARSSLLRDFHDAGTRHIFVYPHAARPNLVNDIRPECEHVTAQFVTAPGHVDVLRAYGYSRPIHVIGWYLCPMQPFRARRSPRNVLFAPIHPRCADVDQKANRAAFERLYALAQSDDIHLTVRYINNLEDAGLTRVDHPNVEYYQGNLDPDYSQIDNADVVVAHQTFAWMAIARGTPCVMMAEDMPSHIQEVNQPVEYVKNWNLYHDLIAYPYDLLACKKPLILLQRAIRSDEEIVGWRDRMIGQPFDPKRFIELIGSYIEE